MLNWDFWQKTVKLFEKSSNITYKFYKAGPSVFRISFHGLENIENFTKAINHLEIKEEDGLFDFNILVSDLVNGEIMLPEPSWSWEEDVDEKGFIASEDKTLLKGRFLGWQNTFYLLNLEQKTGIYWTKNNREIPEWERSFPFRDIFHQFWSFNSDLLILHAAAVGTKEGGLLLTGKGGSGKSTAALACLNSNLKYAGDDLVLVDVAKAKIYSLYNVAKLENHQLLMFPHLRNHIYNEQALPNQKAQLFLFDHFKELLIKEMPLKGIAVTKYSHEVYTSYELSTEAEGLKALAPSTICLLQENQKHIGAIVEVCRKFPVYKLLTGTELQTIPNLIEELIQKLNPSTL
ncbi:hypothetical protein [Lacihabitans soyangensis]|uniref:Serine kinase n=1 Tax=Lacihabitans soyangensis TaxID=869394 RepID=A0AAE3H5X1_9BACT|nr:hypothetical protein [Lacihabitans soyangensis]MCP9765799.1 hypothetical protein [Lacihabitans soyangensis]